MSMGREMLFVAVGERIMPIGKQQKKNTKIGREIFRSKGTEASVV